MTFIDKLRVSYIDHMNGQHHFQWLLSILSCVGGESGNEVTLVLISHLESTTGHETLWGLLNSMLLPQPEEPNSATNSPFATVKVNAFNTSRHMPFCVKPLREVFFILSIIVLGGYKHLYLIWEYPTVYLASNPDFPFLTLSRSFGENPEW